MKVGNSVRKAIDDWEAKEYESAMLHACNAIDGTAKKAYPNADVGNKKRFTDFLRGNYAILGPMGLPQIDIVRQRFHVPIGGKATTADGIPDLADVIYGVHRCTHGHGDELPEGFELMPDAAGPAGYTRVRFDPGAVRLSDRIIFALIAVAVLSPHNRDQHVPAGYHLTFGSAAIRLEINEWWGRSADFGEVLALDPSISVNIDFSKVLDEWAAKTSS